MSVLLPAVNDGPLIGLVLSASPRIVGIEISSRLASSAIFQQPVPVATDTDTAVHIQARHLRIAHPCIADLLPGEDNVIVAVMKVVVKD